MIIEINNVSVIFFLFQLADSLDTMGKSKAYRQPIFDAIHGIGSIFFCLPGAIMTRIGYTGSDEDSPEALEIAGPVMLGIGGLLTVGSICIAFLKDFINKEPRFVSFNLRFQKDTHDLCWLCIYYGLPLAATGFSEANFHPIGVGGAIVLMIGLTLMTLGLLLGKCWRPREAYLEEYQNAVGCSKSDNTASDDLRTRYRYHYLRSYRRAFSNLANAFFISGIPLICVGYLAEEGERVFCHVLGVVFLSTAAQMTSQAIFQVMCNSRDINDDYDIYHLRMSTLIDLSGRLVLLSIIFTPVGFSLQDNGQGLGIGITGAVCGGLNGVVRLSQWVYMWKVPSPPYPEGREKSCEGAAWKRIIVGVIWHLSGYDVTMGYEG